MPCPCSAESGSGSPSPSRWNSSASASRRGSSSLFASTSTGFFAARRIAASSSSPGVIARPRVDDEEHEVGLADRRARLLDDRRGRTRPRRARSTPPVSTIRKCSPFQSREQLLAVARDARRLVHDRGARLRQAVDQRRLADVREADDRDRARELRSPRAHAGGVALPRAAEGVQLDEPVPEHAQPPLDLLRAFAVALARRAAGRRA